MSNYTPILCNAQFLPEQLTKVNLAIRGWVPYANDIEAVSGFLTKDVSNRVSQLITRDKYNFELNQGSGTNQPLWVANGLNGKPIFRFDDTREDVLATDNPVHQTRINTELGLEYFAVVKCDATSYGSDAYVFNQPRYNDATSINYGLRVESSDSSWAVASNRMALVHVDTTDKGINDIAWISGNIVRLNTVAGFDETKVVVDNIMRVEGCSNDIHNGQFVVYAVNTGTIDVINYRVSDATEDVADATGTITTCYSLNVANSKTTTLFGVTVDTDWHMVHGFMAADPTKPYMSSAIYYDDDPIHFDDATSASYYYECTASPGILHFGARDEFAQAFGGDVAEIVVGEVFDPYERGMIKNWLRWAYGVSI